MADKPPLLFLAHRIPYPPNKGDKIRSYNLLKYLAEHFSIYLGAFVDDQNDWQYCSVVRGFCADALFIERHPGLHKLIALRGFLSNEALSVTYYRSARMQRWVDDTVTEHGIKRALLFCSPMAQFVWPGTRASGVLENTIIDFVDVDSEKWRQYAEDRRGPVGWLYRREAERLLATERSVAEWVYHSYFVSEQEATLFRQRTPDSTASVGHFSNGVDTEYFGPDDTFSNPYPADAQVLVFTGAMDYWPNIDAVVSFADEILPELLRHYPRLQLWIVGGKPSGAILALERRPAIRVTGRVHDVRPFLQYAHAAIAPMRVARGIQNKVLEAMAMGRPILASSHALLGIALPGTMVVRPVASAEEYADALRPIMGHDRHAMDADLRKSVALNYSWEAHLSKLLPGLHELDQRGA